MKKTINFWKKLSSPFAFLSVMLATMPAYAVLGQPEPGGFDLQAAASPMKERMIEFHNNLLILITAIALFVLALLLWIVVRYNAKVNPVPSKTTHSTVLEIVWTLIPVFILTIMAIPSMKMLYYVDRTTEAEMTLKVIGNQWYWSYEYPDNGNITFVSNIVKDKDLKPGQPRLLEVDNPVVLPVNTKIKILTAATDVIHSWAVPAFGVKMDAVPGRINETWVLIDKEGTFYGQCSQLCGQGHAYMPIEVKAVSKQEFAEWVHKQGGKMPGEAAAAPAADKKTPVKIPAKAPAKTKNKKAGDK